jgi:3-dehydroquinate synthase
MEKVRVDIENKGYDIKIGEKLLDNISSYISNEYKWMIVTDSNVWSIYGELFERELGGNKPVLYSITPGEEQKNLHTVTEIIKSMLENNFTRGDKIIALGGGVIGDMAGFCAAIFMRGISFVQIPTTLLAQVDSSVGGKTGVNLPEAKNIIGAFHQPELVLIDTSVLKTLPPREVVTGLGEIIKYGLIEDYSFFRYVVSNLNGIISLDQGIMPGIIKRCCEIKAKIVTQDERERGIRKFLNLGHTIAHALETATEYKIYTHGEAVLLGIYYEAKMALKMGLIENAYGEEILRAIKATKINLSLKGFSVSRLIDIMINDKKNKDNRISFILPRGRGRVEEYLLERNIAQSILLDISEV